LSRFAGAAPWVTGGDTDERHHPSMRRRMTALAFAGLLLLGVAGCDSDYDYRNGGEATATGHLPAAPNPMTLTITTFG
jgi:hypothetical protein